MILAKIAAMFGFKRRQKARPVFVLPQGRDLLYLMAEIRQSLSNMRFEGQKANEIIQIALAGPQDEPLVMPVCIHPIGPEWTKPLFQFDGPEDEEVRFFVGRSIARVRPTSLLLDWIEEEGLGITWEHSKNCNYCVNLLFSSDTDLIYFKMKWQE